MKYIKIFLFVLAIPFFLVQMKIEHSKMEIENRKKADRKVPKNNDLFVAADPGPKIKLT